MTNKEDRRWCVYIHTNKINNKAYIGITCNVNKRWGTNGSGYLKTNTDEFDEHPAFANAIRKYKDWDNDWDHIIFSENLTQKEAAHIEKLLIALYQTNCCRYDNPKYGYNMTDGGDGGSGRIWSEKSKQKLSESLTGHITSEETKQKISESLVGRTFSEETLRKMSVSHIGIQSGEKHPMYGKSMSEETKEKLRQVAKGRIISEETRAKMSDSQKERLKDKENHSFYGKHLSEEHRKHISESNKGRKVSDANKKAISEAQSVSVVQLSKDCEFIARYSSMTQAQQLTGIDRRQIGRCCDHKSGRKTAGGFVWMYSEDYEKLINQKEIYK